MDSKKMFVLDKDFNAQIEARQRAAEKRVSAKAKPKKKQGKKK